MTRSTMRTLLRRQIQETTADQWTDSDCNEALNYGLLMVQKEITKVDATAFAYMYTRDITSGVDNYPLPTAFMYEHEVAILNTTTSEYDAIRRVDYVERVAASSLSSDSVVRYAILGRYIFLYPTPTATVTAGLRLLYMPVLTMAEDTDTPEVDDSLHPTIVAVAKLMLLEDTAEAGEETRKRVLEAVLDLPMYRRPGAPEHVTVLGIVDKISGF